MTRFLSILLLGLSLSLAPASAQLLLTVDAAAKTISFSGSDSGAPTGGTARWSGGSGASTVPEVSLTNLFDTSGNFLDARSTRLRVFESGGLGLNLDFVFGSNPATVTGNGNTQGYSTIFTEAEQAILEASDGNVMSLAVGTGWSSINVEVVPEPATGLLFGLGAAALLLRRRRR